MTYTPKNQLLILIYFVLLTFVVHAQSITYLNLPEFGFRHKFPTGYSTHSSPRLSSSSYFIKGYNFVRNNGNNVVDIVLEIYKGECVKPEILFEDFENALRGGKNTTFTFSDVNSEKYISPFGWLVFKGTARKFGDENIYHFYNVYMSLDYVVVIRSFMKNDGFWDVGYNTVADKSDGSSFEPFPLQRNMKELGVSLQAQGFYFFAKMPGEIQGYEFVRCTENPEELPVFRIFPLEGEVKKFFDLRKLEFLQNRSQLLEWDQTDIVWPGEGKKKFTNGKKYTHKFNRTFESGNTYPFYEIYYTFEYRGKPFMVLFMAPLKTDKFLRGYQNSNFSAEHTGREIVYWYEQSLLKILESMKEL
ncbi:MAG: hypothetical protein ACK4EX_10060 [Thermaurantimonas sp.]|uniref:hypothetical protein n=1 Tax=Thermaurantimonas sp. TaxID=2681568 RepID=UPI003919C325